MANSVDISSIKALVGAAKLEDAIKLTIQKGKDEKNDVLERYGILFSGRLTDLSKKVIAGTVSFDDMNREKNDIQAKLLDIIKYYENGRIAELEHTEEFKRLPTPKELGGQIADIKYYEAVQTLKRYWFLYAAFGLVLIFFFIPQMCSIKKEMDKGEAEFNAGWEENHRKMKEMEDKMKESSKTFTANDCRIQSQFAGLDIKMEAKFMGSTTTIGKIPPLTWVKINEISAEKGPHGVHYFFKVKVPNSDKYGWVANDDIGLKDRKGDCFPEFTGQ